MRTARTRLAFSVLIVLAMVSSGLGISAMIKSTSPAVSGPTGDVGTRTDGTPTMVSMTGSNMDEVQESNLPTQTTPTMDNKPTVTKLERDEINVKPFDASMTSTIVNTETGTRNPLFDAGGPYGGPNCYEGSCTVHLEITTDDPTIIFYRWDFNDDGVWDTSWSPDNFYDLVLNDNYYGDIVAEGWDGISTQTYIITGWNLYPATNYYWGLGGPTVVGWKFRAKVDMSATDLYFFNYYQIIPSLRIRIWDYSSRMQLGNCAPATQQTYSWTSCTLSTPIALILGREYWVTADNTNGISSWLLFNNPSVPWDKVEYQNMWYGWSPGNPPDYDWGGGTTYVPMIDFKWRQVLIIPLTVSDTAFLDVSNMPPVPYGIMTDPSPGLEGTPVKFSGWFNDPGMDDTWQYRWYFGDGTWSPWANVKKFLGGASVLMYHSVTGDIDTFRPKVIEACGTFCSAVDAYDFGPLGQNQHMTLDQLMQYDVLWVDTNWGYIPNPDQGGNLLADYMDQKGDQGSGGIVMGNGAFIANSPWDIRGRYFSDEYSPIVKAGYGFGNWGLGTIYVPGHPILDGVTTLTSYMHLNAASLTSGATRVADWTTGYIAVATKPNPIVNNGAMSVAMPFSAWYNCVGDCVLITVNAIKYASRQPDPTPLPMPIQLPWTTHFYKDDDPVTTSPWDMIDVKLEVKDDDHLKVEGTTKTVFTENFESGCSGGYWAPVFPPGWTVNPTSYTWACESGYQLGSTSASIWYYYNDPSYGTGDGESYLMSPTFDLSGANSATVTFKHYWWADYSGQSQAYVEASTDGGVTYPYLIARFYGGQNDGPATRSFDSLDMAGASSVKLRFHYHSADDWGWWVDDIVVTGTAGRLVWGLGEVWGQTAIANVPPTVVGGPQSGSRLEAQSFLIDGLSIYDPAIMEPTEWTAYKMDFDDGTPASWVYKGTLAPPKLDVLFIHHACTSGDTCTSFTSISNRLLSTDLVASVTGYNFFQNLNAPTLSYMLQFDAIMYGGEWAYLGYPAFDAAKLLVGNRLADYLDAHRGGVMTFMAAYDLSIYYGEIFSLTGRYMDQDYGPFEKAEYPFANGVLGTVHYPDHPVMKGVTDVTSGSIHSGNLPTTAGGIRLASWTDGGAAVGVKEKDGDKRSCAVNIYTGSVGGNHATKLLRSCLGWAIGGIPTPDIPAVTHTWGDNGLYTVDIEAIDDDMGYVWDFANNVPLADPMYPQIPTSHRYIPVSVDNVDPTIHDVAAYTEVELCIRMTGNKGNDATLTVMGTDGSYYTVTTTRVPGNPAIGCLPKIKIDMTPNTKYQFDIAYDPTGDDGANPEWIFDSEFPDGKIKELRHTFNSNDGPQVWTIGNKEFKALAIGSPLTFEATASDPGSDDLAFAWVWSELTPYDLHIYEHPGTFYQSAVSDQLNMLPFKEPRFDYVTNDMRSPETDPIRAHDIATHQFAETQMPYFLYVMLIVVDDDNGDPYTSPYLWPGMDLEVIQIDI